MMSVIMNIITDDTFDSTFNYVGYSTVFFNKWTEEGITQ